MMVLTRITHLFHKINYMNQNNMFFIEVYKSNSGTVKQGQMMPIKEFEWALLKTLEFGLKTIAVFKIKIK